MNKRKKKDEAELHYSVENVRVVSQMHGLSTYTMA
jgi:hypothetical protein